MAQRILGLLAVVSALCLGNLGCWNYTVVEGNGKLQKEVRPLPVFSEIIVSGETDLIIQCQADQRLEIEADSNILPLILTDCSNGSLSIHSERGYSSTHKIQLRISMRDLSRLTISGSADARITNVSNDRLEIAISGSGDLAVEGRTTDLKIELDGSGRIDTKSLETANASLTISGSGDAKVTAGQSLDLTISGSGNVKYFGHPQKVNQHISGSGSVSQG